MLTIYKIYDNGGETVDRYTVLTKIWHLTFNHRLSYFPVKVFDSLNLSDDPDHPTYGISQWSEAIDGKHLGKEIKLKDLPQNVQDHITLRLDNTDYLLST